MSMTFYKIQIILLFKKLFIPFSKKSKHVCFYSGIYSNAVDIRLLGTFRQKGLTFILPFTRACILFFLRQNQTDLITAE